MYKLIITEKPSVAQSIAAALGVTHKMDGYLEGNGWLVSWCLGHLAMLAAPEDYDPRYKLWRREDLPVIPNEWRFIVPPERKQRFDALCALMGRGDVDGLVNACDAGREGELIFRSVYALAGCTKPVTRLWISSMEDEAIREGFRSLRPGSEYDNLYAAALCRAQADWLVGINATRLYSVMYHRTLNVGRVVSPTLAMLVRRGQEIEAFRPRPFYIPQLVVNGEDAVGERCDDRADAEAVIASCGDTAVVKRVEHTERTSKAPALPDLTTLQREANRLCGYSAQQTLDYLQALYEKKLVTYPRTDSRYLTDDMAELVAARAAIAGGLCGLAVPEAIDPSAVCDSRRVSDHHAIIPTASAGACDVRTLPEGEGRILALTAWSLLRAVAGDYRCDETVVTLTCGGHDFTLRGTSVISPGWRRYERRSGDRAVPALEEGQTIPVSAAHVHEGKTTPPRAYTEDTLLAAMENAAAWDAPEGAERLSELSRRGIGTPATRAGILEKLVEAGFVTRTDDRKQPRLLVTRTGVSLVKVLPEALCSPALTAEWEQRLAGIGRGELPPDAFRREVEDMVRSFVRTAEPMVNADELFPSGRLSLGRCPRCGRDVTESKKGFFCEGSACRFAIWRDNPYLTGKRAVLTPEAVSRLLADGRVLMRGLHSKRTGNDYDAWLVLHDDGERVRFELDFNVE